MTRRAMNASESSAKTVAMTLSSSPSTQDGTFKVMRILGTVIRTVLLDMPLVAVLGLYMGLLWVHHVHDNYLVPQMAAAEWEEDSDRVVKEMTYYYRLCDESDLSTTDPADLFLPENTTPEEAYQHNLRHGFTLFPRVLSEETATGLRNHILDRNYNLTAEDNIWLEEQQNRWSFPLGTEEPYVTQALMEVASHTLLGETMAKILGDNPAMIEMTAITAAHGARAQSWHQDGPTAPARHGRAFRPGYSVFIQLQNTTRAMGATGACPGLYMCSETPESVCDRYGIQPVNEDGYWRVGDALVMNMDSTHRGSAHIDPDAADRVMFIMTFVTKPRSRAESRQIIQGITFSLRWDMWGHTWQDLLHADTEMTQPWTTLRSLGLYKKPSAVWGEDYISSACQRIAKEDFGFFREHLDDFVSFGGFKFIPRWLQGEVGEDEGWPEFLLETLERCEAFVKGVAFQLAVCYIVCFFAVSILSGESGVKGHATRFGWALVRLGIIYGTISLLYSSAIKHVDESDWAYDIRNGFKYTSPFGNEESAYDGPTTLPHRNDVLIETRYKSKYFGLYNDYIGNHPGNRLWNELLDEKSNIYAAYQGLPSLFRHAIAKYIVSAVHEESGRVLYQSPDGQWLEMANADAEKETESRLAIQSNRIKQATMKEMEFLISEVKYNHLRESAMCKRLLPYLLSLKGKLTHGTPPTYTRSVAVVREEKGLSSSKVGHPFHPACRSRSALLPLERKRQPVRRPVVLNVGELPEAPEPSAWLRAGDTVDVLFRERGLVYSYKADLLQVLSTGVCVVRFLVDDELDDQALPCTELVPYYKPDVGDIVEVESEGEYYECTVVRDHDNGTFDIEVDDELYEVISDNLFRRSR